MKKGNITPHELLEATKKGQTFDIIFTRKDGTVCRLDACDMHHEYVRKNPESTRPTRAEAYRDHQNLVFWSGCMDGWRAVHEPGVQQIVVMEGDRVVKSVNFLRQKLNIRGLAAV